MELSVLDVILAVVISAVAIGLIEFGSWTLAIILGLHLSERKENENGKEEN